MPITINSITNPVYSTSNNALIDVTVNCIQYGNIPMSLHPSDNTTYTMGNTSITNGQMYAQAANGAYGNVAPYVPTMMQTYINTLYSGLSISVTDSANSAVSGTFGASSEDDTNINSILVGINSGFGLPGGANTFTYYDISKNPHVVNQAQFTTIVTSIKNFRYSLELYKNGLGPLPNNSVVINI